MMPTSTNSEIIPTSNSACLHILKSANRKQKNYSMMFQQNLRQQYLNIKKIASELAC